MGFKAVLAAALAVVSLTACGPDPEPPTPPLPPVADVTTTTTEAPPVSSQKIEDALDSFARNKYAAFAREIFTFWTAQYKANGLYSLKTNQPLVSKVDVVYLSSKNPSFNCGTKDKPSVLNKDSAVGPAYCFGTSDTVVMPLAMTRKLAAGKEVDLGEGKLQLSPSQEVGVYFLLAHELGHNVQAEIMGDDQLKKADEVAVENAADCLAGVAIAGVERTFEMKDADTILRMAEEIGQPEAVNHGTPQQRKDAVAYGMLNRPYNSAAVSRGIYDCFDRYLPGYLTRN